MKLSQILLNVAKQSANNKGSADLDKVAHIPVLAQKIFKVFNPQDGQIFIDMTFGGGGHTKYLLMSQKKITIFALDRDPEAFERAIVLAKKVSSKANGQQVVPLLGRFSELSTLLTKLKVPTHSIDGAILDLGASSFQFDQGRRGFSFQHNGPLDMRMDGNRFPNMPTAADVINSLDAEDLSKIFKIYGEEKHAMKVAQAIIDARFMMRSLNSTQELAALVANVLGQSQHDKLGRVSHPATKVFQALRIFINNEMNELNYAIQLLALYLKKSHQVVTGEMDTEIIATDRHNGGLLAAISFHSLEDRIVKTHLMGNQQQQQTQTTGTSQLQPCTTDITGGISPKKWKFFQDRIFYPSENEVYLNPRSRSAKLRFGLRVDHNKS